jgi:hypothetical protein
MTKLEVILCFLVLVAIFNYTVNIEKPTTKKVKILPPNDTYLLSGNILHVTYNELDVTVYTESFTDEQVLIRHEEWDISGNALNISSDNNMFKISVLK